MRVLIAGAAALFVVSGALAQPVVVGRIPSEFSEHSPEPGLRRLSTSPIPLTSRPPL